MLVRTCGNRELGGGYCMWPFRRRKYRSLSYESLEPRRALAVTDSFVAGVLTFNGDAANDNLAITAVNAAGSTLQYDLGAGLVTRTGVNSVAFNGGGGSNKFTLSGTLAADNIAVNNTNVLFGSVNFALAAVQTVAINGLDGGDVISAQAIVGTLVIDGGAGGNTVSLSGSAGVDTAMVYPNYATLVGPGYATTVLNSSTINVSGGANDAAYLFDSAGNDTFVSFPAQSTLSGAGFANRATGFGLVMGLAYYGGTDNAYLYDSAGNDTFSAYPSYAVLNGAGFFNEAAGFDAVFATAQFGGTDNAYLFDSSGNDNDYAFPTYAQLSGSGFFNQAIGFDLAMALGYNGGNDSAYFYDSPGVDTFTSYASYSVLQGVGYFNESVAFEQNFATSQGNVDQAFLYGSAAADSFFGTPTYSYFTGPGFQNTAISFPTINAFGTPAGTDTANLLDNGILSGISNTATQATLVTPSSIVNAFNFLAVTGNSTNSGSTFTNTGPNFTRLGLFTSPVFNSATVDETTNKEVEQLLDRAQAASASTDAIIAIVDRGGKILGVRVEPGVATSDLNFAIDGAVAKARTAAFFSNNQAPLPSRTVRFISQSTITEREVNSDPNIVDESSPNRGPGFVAPIGLGGHFPPGVDHTPPVDLFDIEHTNRDSLTQPGADGVKYTADDIALAYRFNADTTFVPTGQQIAPPLSYAEQAIAGGQGQSRGIATLPGGVPLYKNGALVGGVGVFFPGPNGYASYEQGFDSAAAKLLTNPTTEQEAALENARTNAPRVLESEWIAYATSNQSLGTLGNIGPVAGYSLPSGRIDLVGITLESIGPGAGVAGVDAINQVGASVGRQSFAPFSQGALDRQVLAAGAKYIDGTLVPSGWLVLPHDSPLAGTPITKSDVVQIITQGVNQADITRAAIRLQSDGSPGARTKMMLSVTDNAGNVLGVYRMPDATYFSIDVSVAKARNVSYYNDPTALQPADQVKDATGAIAVAAGVAFTNRTFRFDAEPRFPSGVDGSRPGSFSTLLDTGNNAFTATNGSNNVPASVFTTGTVAGYDAFHPATDFRDKRSANLANQNGIVFFPGSAGIYKNGVLVGGFGVSGDGVDQDDVVTYYGQQGYLVPAGTLRADQVLVDGVRLPYQKFNRNPNG